ncbi:MAG: Cache 3/Cache 2 fusion domain-containing protein [Thermodesulfovibrionales bacterium]|nr:Cache 3/Cache 2 fusion domain-containing protein [Thermodesulfovibrionales bacterium]
MKILEILNYENLKIKWKILFFVLPLIFILTISFGIIIGTIAIEQADKSITEINKSNLENMAEFTRDLLLMHHITKGKPDLNRESFETLRILIKNKKLGKTGYIYCLDSKGNLTIHPTNEGDNIYDATDYDGFYFVREMIQKKNGWIRYPWKNPYEEKYPFKLTRFVYFEPWDWIIAVEAYEGELYYEAAIVRNYLLTKIILIIIVSILISIILIYWASSTIAAPLKNMIAVVRRIKSGRLNEKIPIESRDEIGELAQNFNHMVEVLKKNKEIEKTLNQKQKMASMGVLASEVAHEINNPLGIILGYTSYLEGKVSPTEPAYKYLKEMKKETQRCKKIIENFLNFARIPEPIMKKNDLNHVLDEIINFAMNHPDINNLKIIKEFNENIPLLKFDEDQIKQVAINLILNAAEAMKEDGQLIIKTDFGSDDYVDIIFEDNGCGIPPEHLGKIFEPFFTSKPKGTGLGLAVTKQIVKQHFGHISIESAVGVGTKVTVSLPIGEE